MSATNPRFPHMITITRNIRISEGDKIDTPWDVPNEESSLVSIYKGEGRSYPNNRGSFKDNIVVSNYSISIPYTNIAPMRGDVVEVVERTTTITGIVEDFYLGSLGLTVYWNKDSN